MNDRPEDFPRAMASLLAQEEVDLDIVVIGNGSVPEQVPEGVRTIDLPEDVGILEGRNIGAADAKGEYLFFLDNDALLSAPDTLARLVAESARAPTSHRDGRRRGDGPPRHLRARRRMAVPATDPARHDTFCRLSARNRVPLNIATWLLIALWRTRDRKALRVSLAGFREGLAGGQGARRPMSWKTVARLGGKTAGLLGTENPGEIDHGVEAGCSTLLESVVAGELDR
ncbi:glycosyltransferase family 2 protein [Streptomyces sp. NPDC127112]|uniref:glycosyltransferase family 2 protein n=1 Tax=Streptomyces sp. NPDC127112 TaxID=3345364 RepID=UPI0036339D6D